MSNGVNRHVEVLELIASQPNGVTVTELASMLGVTKASASRMLAAYVEAGLAHRYAGQRHVLGLRLWSFGARSLDFFRPAELARQIMFDASKTQGIVIYLATVRGDTVYYIEQMGPGIQVTTPIHTVLPIHASGPGKAILAFSSDSKIESVAAGPLTAFTRHTLTTRAALLGELAEIRSQGYAVNRGEYDEQAVGLAVPVFDHTGEPVAAIGNAPAASLFNEAYIRRVGPILVEVGASLSAALGYARVGLKVH